MRLNLAQFQGSKLKFVARLFDDPPPAEAAPITGKGGRRGGGGAAKSLSATFRADLGSLMEAINAADPHFVRALNPNAQVARFFVHSFNLVFSWRVFCSAKLSYSKISKP